MITPLKNILSHERMAFFAFATLAALALAAAYTSQFAYGLQPCELCVYQRIPYAIVVLLGICGIAFSQISRRSGPVFLGLIALAYAVDAGVAVYHSGVERHWWRSFLEGCTVPDMEGNITDVLARIAATPLARCDEIPWTDPVLGLSMANYNVFFALILTMASLYALSRQASWQNPARP
jgi:disulfide bond formation protein DsbB